MQLAGKETNFQPSHVKVVQCRSNPNFGVGLIYVQKPHKFRNLLSKLSRERGLPERLYAAKNTGRLLLSNGQSMMHRGMSVSYNEAYVIDCWEFF